MGKETASAGPALRLGRNPAVLPSFAVQHSVHLPDDLAACEPARLFPHLSLPGALQRAVPKRRLEFLAGRHCALMALGRWGVTPVEPTLGIGPGGAPSWPDGFIGSITHSSGFVSAAIARTESALGIGIDSEGIIEPRVADEIRATITHPDELLPLQRAGFDAAVALTLVFCTKEAVFKCLYPSVGRFFDYLAAQVLEADPSAGQVRVRLCVDLGPRHRAGQELQGRFELDGGLVHTGLVLPAAVE